MRALDFVLAGIVWTVVLGGVVAQPAQDPGDLPDFGGRYADLTPRQKELIDDLCSRFVEVTGVELDVEHTSALRAHDVRGGDPRAQPNDTDG